MTTGRSSTGRSPAPPRGASAAASASGGGGGGGGNNNRPRGGGGSSFLSSSSSGRPSLDAMRGRLSYGSSTAAATTPAAAAATASHTNHNDIFSPESAASTAAFFRACWRLVSTSCASFGSERLKPVTTGVSASAKSLFLSNDSSFSWSLPFLAAVA